MSEARAPWPGWPALALALALAAGGAAGAAPALGFRVVAAYPHDRGAFTQGLVFAGGRLFESTGLRGRSSLREVDLASGRVLRLRPLAAHLFGEGLARVGERLYQITWTSGRGFVYRLDTLAPVGRLRYRGQGWGLAYDGRDLLMSDGSAVITRRDPATFAARGRFTVRDGAQEVTRLNGLEFVEGSLYANVWQSDRIARIDPSSGAVTGWLELAVLRRQRHAGPGGGALNGIAWDPRRRHLLVTGKLWARVLALELER